MRIVCQKCSAAYAIDDKLVTPKGIRAQCPRCRHLQLVKQGDAMPAVTEPAVPAPFPVAAPAPPPPAAAAGGDADLFFDFAAPPTKAEKAQAQPQPPPPAVSLSLDSQSGDMLDFSDLGEPPPEPATSPRALAPLPSQLKKAAPPPSAPKPQPLPPAPAPSLAPQSSAPFDFSGDFSFDSPPSGPGLSLKKNDSQPPPSRASQPAAGPGAMAAPAVKCKQCGKVLTDPFDQALGICDDCRNSQSGASALSPADSTGRPTSSAAVSRPPPPQPRVPETSSDAFGAPDSTELPTVAEKAPRPPKPSKPARQLVSAYREGEEPREGSGKFVAMAAVLVLFFGAGGAYLFIKKPWVKKPPPLAQKLPISSARPIDAMVERWKAQYPSLTGSAAEHLAAGEEKLALDTSTAYAEAESEFQKALVLDKSNDRAIAGWALALAFGKGDAIDADTQKMAEQMLLAAEQRGGDARVYVAHAHLLLVRSANLNDIQVLAERGTASPSGKDQALAHLALGQAYLNKNPKSAESNFEQAVKADPKLKRAYLYQVRLMVSQGDFRTAVLTLEKRLEGDPDQFEAADLLGKLYLDVGEPALAKKTYQKVAAAAPSAVRPKLALAMFAYQHDGDAGGAAAALDGLLAQRDSLDKPLLAELLGHRAAVARLLGDFSGAVSNADAALQLNAGETNAHVQKLLASVATGNAAQARAHLSQAKLEDAAVAAMFEGRVLMAEGKHAEAFEKLKKSQELDARRTDALLLAAAAAVKAKNESKGWEYVLAKGYKADPMQSGPRAPMAAVFFARSDFIGAARGTFAKLGKDAEDPNPRLAEGILAWHAGDLGTADSEFAKVIAADPTNGTGFTFRTLIAIRRRDFQGALKLGTKAVAYDRSAGLAHCALGWAQLLTNKPELARQTLKRAVELAPTLHLARARLAEADVKVKKIAEAKTAMATVLLADATYVEAKRVLYGITQ